MDDKHLEDLLRHGWNPEAPEGMRDRVLRKARMEESCTRMSWRWGWTRRWKLAVAGLAVATIVATNVSESARDSRMLVMVCGEEACQVDAKMESSLSRMSILSQREQMYKLLAQALEDDLGNNGTEGHNGYE